MSWYECPKCGRNLARAELYEARCRDCGDVVIQLRGAKATVNLNTASKLELQRIGGIGPKMAEKIIQHRPYNDVADLQRIHGIGKGTYDKVKYKVYVK